MQTAPCCSIVFSVLVAACIPQQPAPAYPEGPQAPSGASASMGARQLTINGVAPSGSQLEVLAQVEAGYGVTLLPGRYWYDAVSGAFGRWGGPTEAVIAAGLDLGPPVPANASGGDTSVVINGRGIQTAEKAYLEWLIGSPIKPGRYTIDAHGNAGLEGRAPMVNLTTLAAQRNNTNNGTRSVYGGTDHAGRASWFESDGKCKYIETPSGGFSSGC